MVRNLEQEIDSLRRSLDELSREVRLRGGETAAAQPAETVPGGGAAGAAGAAGVGEAASAQAVIPEGQGGNTVTAVECDGCLQVTGSFTGGGLTLTVGSTHDVATGAKSRGFETMVHDKLGLIFKRSERMNRQQVVLRYDFGPSVRGPRSLVLVGERTPRTTFVYGLAEGRPLLPVAVPVGACPCGHDEGEAPILVAEESGARPLEVLFPPDYAEALRALVPSIKASIAEGRYSASSLQSGLVFVCFWGNLACELAAKACILGCAGNPICMVACLVAEVACLAAVAESHGDI